MTKSKLLGTILTRLIFYVPPKIQNCLICTAASYSFVEISGANNFRRDLKWTGMDCGINAVLFNVWKSL